MRSVALVTLTCLLTISFRSNSYSGWSDMQSENPIIEGRVGVASVADILARLEVFLKRNLSKSSSGLHSAATEEDLADLEAATGLLVPEGLRAVLKIRNGGTDSNVFGEGFDFLSAAEIAEHWRMHVDVLSYLPAEALTGKFDPDVMAHCDPGVRPLVANRKWLPFADSNGDVTRYIDLDPALGGRAGQVIEVDPEATEWRVLAPSFEDFLLKRLKDLEGGK
jgi:molybdopterin molybdotransferase